MRKDLRPYPQLPHMDLYDGDKTIREIHVLNGVVVLAQTLYRSGENNEVKSRDIDVYGFRHTSVLRDVTEVKRISPDRETKITQSLLALLNSESVWPAVKSIRYAF